jgi:hypothetical protein
MALFSFSAQKLELDDACLFLRSFTLGHQGFTQRDGAAGIQRVNRQCDQLIKDFASGPYAKQTATIVRSARTRVEAAQARMAVLGKKS